MPGLLTREGYLTVGIVDTPFYIRHGYGYDRGFEDFYFIRGQNAGPARDDVVEAIGKLHARLVKEEERTVLGCELGDKEIGFEPKTY